MFMLRLIRKNETGHIDEHETKYIHEDLENDNSDNDSDYMPDEEIDSDDSSGGDVERVIENEEYVVGKQKRTFRRQWVRQGE